MTRFRRYFFRVALIAVVFCVTISSLAHAASTIDEDKQATTTLITTILDAEFNGDPLQRKNRVIWSKAPLYRGNSDCGCGFPNSYFSVNHNNSYIVSKWKIANSTFFDNEAYFDVYFYTIGYFWRQEEAHPWLGYQVLPIMKPINELVQYQLKKMNGKWYLYDPSFPRIGIEAIIKDATILLNRHKKPASYQYSTTISSDRIEDEIKITRLLEEELVILREIAKDKPLHLIAEDNLSNPAAH